MEKTVGACRLTGLAFWVSSRPVRDPVSDNTMQNKRGRHHQPNADLWPLCTCTYKYTHIHIYTFAHVYTQQILIVKINFLLLENNFTGQKPSILLEANVVFNRDLVFWTHLCVCPLVSFCYGRPGRWFWRTIIFNCLSCQRCLGNKLTQSCRSTTNILRILQRYLRFLQKSVPMEIWVT